MGKTRRNRRVGAKNEPKSRRNVPQTHLALLAQQRPPVGVQLLPPLVQTLLLQVLPGGKNKSQRGAGKAAKTSPRCHLKRPPPRLRHQRFRPRVGRFSKGPMDPGRKQRAQLRAHPKTTRWAKTTNKPARTNPIHENEPDPSGNGAEGTPRVLISA